MYICRPQKICKKSKYNSILNVLSLNVYMWLHCLHLYTRTMRYYFVLNLKAYSKDIWKYALKLCAMRPHKCTSKMPDEDTINMLPMHFLKIWSNVFQNTHESLVPWDQKNIHSMSKWNTVNKFSMRFTKGIFKTYFKIPYDFLMSSEGREREHWEQIN